MATQQDISPPVSLDSLQSGFPTNVLANKLEVKHLCNMCGLILRRPLQAPCGHRYCSGCLKRMAFPDNAARREVEALPAVCPNEGCVWKGTIKDYETNHEGQCEFRVIPCPACCETIRFNEREHHSERECPERTLNCKYCKELFYFKNIKAHDEICHKFPMTCEGCAKKKIPREKVENEKVPEHERVCAYEHLNMLLHYIMSIKMNLEDLQPQSLENTSLKIHRLHESVTELELKLGQLNLAPVQGAAAAASSRTLAPLRPVGPLEQQSSMLGELQRKTQELELKIGTLENIICVLNREVERSSTSLEANSRQHRLDQEKIEMLSNKVQGRPVFRYSIMSCSFYTSKYGYKMCMRIYLNGDGTGRGSHLSLFFVVMRGQSDALLKWPFNQKVTLMLLNQNNREHIIDAFRPDVTSSSFQRPVSEMNIASGCPLFCPLLRLDAKNSYIRDDTIFIKAIVDLTGL
ncbi:UNVERIFIED_CONTAM: hypothetical protein FKN15_066451 [Acipenser sinensis]